MRQRAETRVSGGASSRARATRENVVTICILSYNNEVFLGESIESAMAQTYRPIEIVVVDDGSEDRSLEIAQEFASRHPELVRVHTHPGRENRGISATANLGFECSTGLYWSVMGSDDVLYPDKTEIQVRWLERYRRHGFVYSYADFVDEETRPLGRRFGTDLTLRPDPLKALLLGNQIPAMTVLVRRHALEAAGLHEESLLYSDWALWGRLMSDWDLGFVRRPLGGYRVHGRNISVGVEKRLGRSRTLAVMEHLRTVAPSNGGRLAEHDILALLDLRCAGLQFELGNLELAESRIERALRTYPEVINEARGFIRWLGIHRRSSVAAKAEKLPFVYWVWERLPRESLPKLQTRARRYLASLDLRARALRERHKRPGLSLALMVRSFLVDPSYLLDLPTRGLRWLRSTYRLAFLCLLSGSSHD